MSGKEDLEAAINSELEDEDYDSDVNDDDNSSLSSGSGQEEELFEVESGVESGLEEDEGELYHEESDEELIPLTPQEESDEESVVEKESDDEEDIIIYRPKNIAIIKQHKNVTLNNKLTHFNKIAEGTKIGKNWSLGKFVTETSKYQIYQTNEKEDYVIKLEFSNPKPKLEIDILNKISQESFIPKLPENFHGKNNDLKYNYIVMKWDGKTLLDYNKDFKNIYQNIYDSIEILHGYDILYIDFSPENFSYPSNSNHVKFINFEYAQEGVRKNDKLIGTPREPNVHLGVKEYNSLSLQKGARASAESDIESFIYLMVASYNDWKLPWFNSEEIYKLKNKEDILNIKEFDNSTKKIYEILSYLRSSPEILDYKHVNNLIENIYVEQIDEEIEQKINVFNDVKDKLKVEIMNMISAIDLEDYYFTDNLCSKLADLYINKKWYNVKYDDRTEKIITTIDKSIKYMF